MALRTLARRVLVDAAPGVRLLATPTVFDKMVQFYVIDPTGIRHTVRGLEGQTAARAMREYSQFDDNVFLPNPFEPATEDAHVYVAYDYVEKLPALPAEQAAQQQRVMEDYVRLKARGNSRMAHYIKLTPALNGVTLALGEHEPWQTC